MFKNRGTLNEYTKINRIKTVLLEDTEMLLIKLNNLYFFILYNIKGINLFSNSNAEAKSVTFMIYIHLHHLYIFT